MSKYSNKENDTVIRLRLPSVMKEDLQTLVERRDINLSLFLRNYIESILTEDENQEVLRYEPLGKVFVDDMDATISIRCHKTLKDLYNASCADTSVKGSGILRRYMRDIVEVKHKMYADPCRSLEQYLDYILIFLFITEYNNHGHAFKNIRRYKDNNIPKDAPSIERIDKFTYRINDIHENCYYLITFEDLSEVDIAMTPFK